MAPNIYANISLVQPHAQTLNDLPIRLYGVQNIEVVDPATRLEPIVSLPAELRPEQKFTVQVSEKSGKPMAYTLAIVDEGLLDLTRFRTPDPWPSFFQREALGVKTWDLYDNVLGAFGGEIQRLLSIGGDDEVRMPEEDKARRFKPVVLYAGPFELRAGITGSHSFTMPQYVGSVRAMVIAAHEGAYGSSEATRPVVQPVMVQATLPRVAGPVEDIDLPVTVFNMENRSRNVKVSVEAGGALALSGPDNQEVAFSGTGDQMVFFKLKSKAALGAGRVRVKAVSGDITSNYDVDLQVRPSNPPMTNVSDRLLVGGESWQLKYEPLGALGTNSGVLEVSSMPPLNLDQRLQFLVLYPHGCLEQTTSAAFAQLNLDLLTGLESDMQARIEQNIKTALERMRGFQLPSGGFTYWPGQDVVNEWATTYAGHFMIEARDKGYFVPENIISMWISYQTDMANRWEMGNRTVPGLEQAYRLYTLALAKSPALGAMNRLREKTNISMQAKWRLALAYLVAGHEQQARSMIEGLSTQVDEYRELSGSFGSAERDRAMILETMVAMGRAEEAFVLVREIAEILGNSGRWMSTQSTAYALIGIARYADKYVQQGSSELELVIGGRSHKLQKDRPISQFYLEKRDESVDIALQNKGNTGYYVRLIRRGIPLEGTEAEVSRGIQMELRYRDMSGNPVDPSRLEQGTNFVAEVSLFNPGIRGDYEELALSQIFPSGWEIVNTRLGDNQPETTGAKYMDIRDDRVSHYFDLGKNQRKTFRVPLIAAYRGRFYLPAAMVEAMYDDSIHANSLGMWVEVIGGK